MGRKVKVLDGQISIFDTAIKHSQIKDKEIKRHQVTQDSTVLTSQQQEVFNQFKGICTKAIICCGGGLIIEHDGKQKYYNSNGKEEFELSQYNPLPADEILISQSKNIINTLQAEKLVELKKTTKWTKVIHRKGDKNLIIECENKIVAINPRGWILEFQQSKVKYKEDEIIEENKENVLQQIEEYKKGDTIKVKVKNKVFTATIYSIYNNNNTFNIITENSHTAIHRSCIVSKVA